MTTTRSSQSSQPNDEVVNALLGTSRALVGVAARSLLAVDGRLTLVQYRALLWLAEHGPMKVGSLAEATGIHASTATRLCDRLVDKGLIERTTHPDDRREVVLRLTPGGLDIVHVVTERRREELRRVLAHIDSASAKAVVDALSTFNEAAGELPDDAWHLGWS